MKALWPIVCAGLLAPVFAGAELRVVIVEGLAGEPRYAEQFSVQVAELADAATSMAGATNVRVFRAGDYSRQDVLDYFAKLAPHLRPDDRLAIFLVGHGSYDDYEYKFNIPGPDLSDADLVSLLDAAAGTSLLLVNTSSASGAVLDKLKGDNRTLILATRSGVERHATRFGSYFAAALKESSADLDKNRIITAEEAFRFAERQVADYYDRNGQLATEHPRIEGGQAGRFGLARLGAAQPTLADAELERLIRRRDALNGDIETLRLSRDTMAADAYQTALLERMLELATLEESIERREQELANEN